MCIGPYFSYYYYGFSVDFYILDLFADQKGAVEGSYPAFNLDVEMGDHFVFHDRFVLDFVIIDLARSYCMGRTEIKGSLDEEAIGEIYERILKKIPVLNLVNFDNEVRYSSNFDAFKLGFRFINQIAHRF